VLLTRSFESRTETRQSGGLSPAATPIPLNATVHTETTVTACTVSSAKSTHEQMTVTPVC